jgi:hypothetical protein
MAEAMKDAAGTMIPFAFCCYGIAALSWFCSTHRKFLLRNFTHPDDLKLV